MVVGTGEMMLNGTRSALGWIIAGLLVFVTACGEPGDDASDPPVGTLQGTVDYVGASDGIASAGRPLALAVYTSLPPAGPPLRTLLLEDYTLPQAFVFEGLPPGSYYVGALIDIDRMDTQHIGMLNPTRDPFGYAGDGSAVRLDSQAGVVGLTIELRESE